MDESLVWQLKKICVFCENSSENISDFVNATKDLGKVLGKQKIRSIFGNSDVGFMGSIAEIIPTTGYATIYNTYEWLLDLSNCVDAFIVLPPGFKTLEEMFTIATSHNETDIRKLLVFST